MTKYLYDGDALVGEYNASGTMTARYVHGDQVDEPWVQFAGTSTSLSNTRFLHSNHQGSVIAQSNTSAAVIATNAYDTYGVSGGVNIGRFGYTGQIWFKELSLYYYKARIYHPKLGRFLQTDPIGYEDQMNLYAYVGNDPVNIVDPDGKEVRRAQQEDIAIRENAPEVYAETYPESGTDASVIELNLSWGGAVSLEVGTVKDSHGNKGFQLSIQTGGGTPEASIEAGKEYTNADSITDLSGPSGTQTLGGGTGLVGSVSTIVAEKYQGVSATGGISAPIPVPANTSAGVEYTKIFVWKSAGKNN